MILVNLNGPDKGRSLHQDFLRSRLQGLMVAAGVPRHYTPHSIRHSASAKALQVGVALWAGFAAFRWSRDSKVFWVNYSDRQTASRAVSSALMSTSHTSQ